LKPLICSLDNRIALVHGPGLARVAGMARSHEARPAASLASHIH